jgi:hypothetical protein
VHCDNVEPSTNGVFASYSNGAFITILGRFELADNGTNNMNVNVQSSDQL